MNSNHDQRQRQALLHHVRPPRSHVRHAVAHVDGESEQSGGCLLTLSVRSRHPIPRWLTPHSPLPPLIRQMQVPDNLSELLVLVDSGDVSDTASNVSDVQRRRDSKRSLRYHRQNSRSSNDESSASADGRNQVSAHHTVYLHPNMRASVCRYHQPAARLGNNICGRVFIDSGRTHVCLLRA